MLSWRRWIGNFDNDVDPRHRQLLPPVLDHDDLRGTAIPIAIARPVVQSNEVYPPI
jgi:hypothetical protein